MKSSPHIGETLEVNNIPKFPETVIPFSNLIKAPDNLKKRLAFIGLIEKKENILELQKKLLDGQILVSAIGEIWRWDGYVSKGKQSSSTKAILEQLKNRRLKQLSDEEKKWQEIMNMASKRIEEFNERKISLNKDLEKMISMPENISSEKNRLQVINC